MEKAVFTNMCMVYDNKGNILVQDRLNSDWPGITFPGGHVEKNESFIESTIREVREETGLVVSNLKLCGVKQFQTLKDERYIVFLYKTNCYQGEIKSSKEGKIFWIKAEDLSKYELAADFLELYKVFVDDSFSEFKYEKSNEKWKINLL